MVEMDRARYAASYGPTTGDRVRLADTDLLIEVTEDRCGGPGRAGDEAVFGGGKVIRESMGQSRATRAEGAPDLVITGAVVLDYWGIVKGDVGVRAGRVVAVGKAGNPDIMDGVTPSLVIGPSTEVVAGNGMILTAGVIDCHVDLICPQVIEEGLASGVTTVVGGGTGPAEGTRATTVTPGAWYLARMLAGIPTGDTSGARWRQRGHIPGGGDPHPVVGDGAGHQRLEQAEAAWPADDLGVEGEDARPAEVDDPLLLRNPDGGHLSVRRQLAGEVGVTEPEVSGAIEDGCGFPGGSRLEPVLPGHAVALTGSAL